MRARILGIVAAGVLATSTAWGDSPPPADNSGTNVRDRDPAAITALDQSEKEGDIRITQTIRQALVDDDSMSTNAQNIKVITIDSVVTLRGPVEDAKERDQIAAIASRTSGVSRVNNQLEVAP
ncbi:MAG: BON domain-containing protein [Candidatus Binatia bacterium]